ncbi:hypothetical protein EF294_17415 [Gordonia oryzae]|uniref:Uncharacterized protein n=1 Tax=Gordonia oryzae TaxID=2487349 RepID=A0A3N4GY00_9ACTN|nr:hypothetical protein EF294_17415 [Gordonia oryzae]
MIAAEVIGADPVLTVSGPDDEPGLAQTITDDLLWHRNNPADRYIRREGARHFLHDPGIYPSTVLRTRVIDPGRTPTDEAAARLSLTEKLVGVLVGTRCGSHTVSHLTPVSIPTPARGAVPYR